MCFLFDLHIFRSGECVSTPISSTISILFLHIGILSPSVIDSRLHTVPNHDVSLCPIHHIFTNQNDSTMCVSSRPNQCCRCIGGLHDSTMFFHILLSTRYIAYSFFSRSLSLMRLDCMVHRSHSFYICIDSIERHSE